MAFIQFFKGNFCSHLFKLLSGFLLRLAFYAFISGTVQCQYVHVVIISTSLLKYLGFYASPDNHQVIDMLPSRQGKITGKVSAHGVAYHPQTVYFYMIENIVNDLLHKFGGQLQRFDKLLLV